MTRPAPVGIALVGCGYVADFYMESIPLHADLEVVGVSDRDAARATAFADYHRVRRFAHLDELLGDPAVEIIVNLTNPASHYAVSRAALDAGRHVYTEKPLAMSFHEAADLRHLADSAGLVLAGAPCSVMGESAQTMWKQLRAGSIGRPRLAYADLDDGPVHRMNYREWRSASGAPWPWRHEFATGSVMEHAAYAVSWLVAFFGPALRLTSFAATLVPDRTLDGHAKDFGVACLEFERGVVARLTTGTFAPRNRALRVFGDDGALSVRDVWDSGSPVHLTRRTPLYSRFETNRLIEPRLRRRVPLLRRPPPRNRNGYRMDYALGIAETAASIREGRRCRLASDFTLHVAEIVLAMNDSAAPGSARELRTSFEPVTPMPFAGD